MVHIRTSVTYHSRDGPESSIGIFPILHFPFLPTLPFLVPHPSGTTPILQAENSASIGIFFDVLPSIVDVIARVVYVELCNSGTVLTTISTSFISRQISFHRR